MAANALSRYGWTTVGDAPEPNRAASPQPNQAASQGLSSAENGTTPVVPGANPLSGLALPRDKAITISVIAGPSKGMKYELGRPLISIGRSGAGADLQVNDPKVSGVHCVIGVNQEMIRLCDLDSAEGTYFNDERVQTAGLEHLSEFRAGSSWFLLTVISKRDREAI